MIPPASQGSDTKSHSRVCGFHSPRPAGFGRVANGRRRLSLGAALCATALLLAIAIAPGVALGAAPRFDPPTAPLSLRPGLNLAQQYGYAPDYVRNVPDFFPLTTDPANQLAPAGTPVIRSRTADIDRTSFAQTLTGGVWQRFSMLTAIRAAYPKFTGTINAAGWDNQHIVFDSAGIAYTVLTIKLSDGTQHNVMLYSADACHTWGLATSELPAGEVTTELWTGHDQLDGPPFVFAWRLFKYHPSRTANYEYLFVTQPHWTAAPAAGGQLVIPTPVQVTTNCFGVSAHSGGGSMAVTRGGKTFFVWGEIDTGRHPGSPIFAAQYVYDPAAGTGSIAAKVQIGYAAPRNDEHCTPVITVTSLGYLYVIAGAHDAQLNYYRSNAPDSITSGWTGPTAIPGAVGGTYVGLVCDQADTLHVLYRQQRRDPQHFGNQPYGALVYQQLKTPDVPGAVWSTPQTLIYPAGVGYVVYYQELTLDPFGRLWMTASNLSGAELNRWRVGWRIWRQRGRHGPRPSRYLHNLVLTSADGGASWHLAATSDFVPPTPVRAVTLAARTAPTVSATTAPGSVSDNIAAAFTRATAQPMFSTGLGTWQWLAPKPQGNDISGVWFVNRTTGWAVGDAGTLLYTSNGGKTWSQQASHTDDDLFDVQFVDEKTGWVVGEHGTVLKTTNAGRTWKGQHSHTANTLFAISFFDKKTGLVVGDSGTIIKTSNAGKAWSPKISLTASGLYGVSFADKDHAWAVGDESTIIASIDGGKSWKAQYPPAGGSSDRGAIAGGTAAATGAAAAGTGGAATATAAAPRRIYPNLYDVWFVSPKVGFAAGEQNDVIVTRNGGKTWSIMTEGTADTWYALRFATPKIGWLVGTGGQVMQTKDAGRSWKQQTSSTSSPLLCVASVDKAAVWAGGEGGALMASANGGGRWSALSGSGYDLDALASASSSKLVAAGTGGVLLQTTDAGQHWARKASGTQAALRGLDFLNATHGWAAGDAGTLLHTTNGGAKWTAGVSGTGQDLRAVQFVDAASGWAVGSAGTVLHSADGGASWAAQASGVSVDLTGVRFVNAAEGWAVGGDAWGEDHAIILHTTDGGVTWIVQLTAGWGQLRAVTFSSALVGWAVGDDWGSDADTPQAVVWHTTDGGVTWTPHWFGQAGGLNAVVTQGDAVAIASGDNGLLEKTTNGGGAWKALRSGSRQDLRALCFVSGSVGYAAGENGSVLFTARGGQ
jgi:photosystem II stability/assembly factor-like uncharacterized protein